MPELTFVHFGVFLEKFQKDEFLQASVVEKYPTILADIEHHPKRALHLLKMYAWNAPKTVDTYA